MKSVEFGDYIRQLRTEHQLSQKTVADKLGVDISLLCKIELGERQIQSHMLPVVAELFNLDYRQLQIEFLSKRMFEEYSEEPFFIEAMKNCLLSFGKKITE